MADCLPLLTAPVTAFPDPSRRRNGASDEAVAAPAAVAAAVDGLQGLLGCWRRHHGRRHWHRSQCSGSKVEDAAASAHALPDEINWFRN